MGEPTVPQVQQPELDILGAIMRTGLAVAAVAMPQTQAINALMLVGQLFNTLWQQARMIHGEAVIPLREDILQLRARNQAEIDGGKIS